MVFELQRSGISCREVGKELDISSDLDRRWRPEDDASGQVSFLAAMKCVPRTGATGNSQLKKGLKEGKIDRDILKDHEYLLQ
jgi:hypothetical protein